MPGLKVKSAAELKARALRLGASVDVGGARYNTGGARVEPTRFTQRTKPTEPQAAPAAAAAAPQDSLQQFAAVMVELLAPRLAALPPTTPAPTPAPPPPEPEVVYRTEYLPAPARPVEWSLDPQRDARGLLTEVVARAKNSNEAWCFVIARGSKGRFTRITAKQEQT